ncbi:thioredoxin-like domain-containing protein [Pelagicoccus sp. SDUM812005]|uniref:thioredoxin-like domain-containing protein n=1 Tax=Pelagicoccus sp. SDUM812005 TaxID=3041257 RepID=UPI00280C5101|nr:thioredoxin-like domain-containing protein [Pelagicoccus sp. SDUM812005]MDQ8182250.1 thioredoxin-like domain-containing protein [Pelagicoccus sp. SDUM812005]
MNPYTCYLCSLSKKLGVLTLLFAIATPSFSEPKIETTVLAPLDAFSVQIDISGRFSAVLRQGSRFAVSVDGEVGPRFDRLLAADGSPTLGRSQFPAIVSQDRYDHPVIFSAGGKRYAYVGLQGSEYVVMVDGKEVHRAPYQTGAIEENNKSIVRFSPQGKRYWFIAKHDLPGERPGDCLFIDGKPIPIRLATNYLRNGIVFSADETRYAADPTRGEMILNGKLAGYEGTPVQFLPNGKLVATSGAATLVDGKVLHPNLRLPIVSSNGRIGGIAEGSAWVDGKTLLNTEGADSFLFSPDGKRIVVHGREPQGIAMWQWLDGKRGPSYSSFQNVLPASEGRAYAAFTADSSLCVSIAFQGGLNYPLVNGEESDGYKYTNPIVLAPQGNRFAYGATTTSNGSVAVFDSQVLSDPTWRIGNANTVSTVVDESIVFSPDGKRSAFAIGGIKTGAHYIDGKCDDIGDHVAMPFLANGFAEANRTSAIFSPDSKRVAYVTRKDKTYHVHVDGKSIWSQELGIRSRAYFTPDSKHFLFFNDERATDRPGRNTVLYINGQRVAAFDLQTVPNNNIVRYAGATHMGDDGELRLIAANAEGFVRHTIEPSPSYTLADALQATDLPLASNASDIAPAPTQISSAAVRVQPIQAVAQPIAAPTVAVAPLSWSELVRKREAWPQTAIIQKELRFSDGAVVRSGSEIEIVELKTREVVASANRGRVTFAVEPEATTTLDAANAAWATLTPEQRDLSYRDLANRSELWPYRLKLAVPVEFSGAPSLKAGDEVLFLKYDRNQLLLRIPNSDIAFNFEAENTDLLQQARDRLAKPDSAPGRLLEELAGKLVDPATGRRVELPQTQPQYVILYMGAGWCPPCKVFAPKLVSTLKQAKLAPDMVTIVYVSGDKSSAEAKRYTSSLGIEWPMLTFTNRGQLPAFESLFGDTIPQLVVTDRHGTVLIDSAKIGHDRALAELQKLSTF